MKKSIKVIICIMMIVPTTVLAHPGRTDSKGCHKCNAANTDCAKWGLEDYEYHCHSGNTYTNSKGEVYNKSGTKIKSGGSSNTSTTSKDKYIYGCTDKEAKNYNSKANKDNGKCEYYVYGCMDEEAKNYNPSAEKDDKSCEYYVYGCTDKEAKNYNESAEKDDDTCEYYKYGCMDINATNYDETAEKDDNSCEYDESNTTEEESSGIGTLVTLGGIGTAIYFKKKKRT